MSRHAAAAISAQAGKLPDSIEDQDIPCRAVDPAIMYPEPRGATRAADGKRVCGPCPARTECLVWALRTGQQFGIWGGFTPGERRRLLRDSARRRAELDSNSTRG